MKQYRIYNFFLLLIFCFSVLTGCNDWLDVEKLGSMTDEQVYSDENNINAVLNGIYSDMSSSNLYGGHMALSTLEYLGHYYYYPERNPGKSPESGNKLWEYHLLGFYDYSEDEIKERFQNVWETGYKLIFGLNVFMKGVEETGVINQRKKNLLLGEAYGLRAFLHFDLFRLFGPVLFTKDEDGIGNWQINAESIPYNDRAIVVTNNNLPADEFMEKLLKDIEMAKQLLTEDPILTEGLTDNEKEYNDWSTAEKFQKIFRNRRFNYYAVCALEARILIYKGDYQNAAIKAQEVIDNTQNGELSLFQFEDYINIVSDKNFIFYNEVIFALHNINLSTTWDNTMNSTELGRVQTVSEANLRSNIFSNESSDFSSAQDYRARQWVLGQDFSNQMFSYKYKMSTLQNDNKIKNHQPLIRISEMFLILAECCLEKHDLAGATEMMGNLQIARGIQVSNSEYAANLSTLDELDELLEREYYKEFFGEGQVFFFHKRRNSEEIFKGYDAGKVSIENSEKYVIPLPKSETNL